MVNTTRRRGVTLFFSIFAAVVIVWLVRSFFNPSPTNVFNTHSDSLNYSASLVETKKSAQALKAEAGVTIEYYYESNTVVIQFPVNELAPVGRVMFFNAANKKKDKIFEVKTDPSRRMFVQLNDFEAGRWRVLVEWQGEATVYSKEVSIDVRANVESRPLHK